MTDKEKDDFIKWVKSLTKDEFYEECVECRRISFGSSEGDDMDYFYMLVNAYVAAEKQVFIDKACEWWENEFQISMMDFQDSKDFYNRKLENFRKAMEE